jgi:hypothetical protein
MRECESHSWISWGLTLFIQAAPYVLFYVGIFLWYMYGHIPQYLTAARYRKMKDDLHLDLVAFQNYSGSRS